jgi:signal recognition particle receptor subunit beta
MSNHKIIFTGPVGAGKTTAIASISDVPPVCTGELATDMTKTRKSKTTVALDYGIMNLDGKERIHLYGTPGQERFDFMWDILTEGGIGLVLLLNNSRPDPFQDMLFFLDAFKNFIDDTHVVIGITRTDEKPRPTTADYHLQIKQSGHNIPIFEVDARKKRDVSLLVEALLYSLDPGVAC